MKNSSMLLAALALLHAAAFRLCAEDPPKTAPATTAHVPGDPKTPDLRQPGFMFMEFGTAKPDEYVAYFEKVTDFKLVHRQPGYMEMETSTAQVMFIDPAILPKGHPFYEPPPGGKRDYSMEIGLVVADLDKAFAAASTFKDKGWAIASGIAMRPWGVRDFRVLTPDGYYLRFTEGHPTK